MIDWKKRFDSASSENPMTVAQQIEKYGCPGAEFVKSVVESRTFLMIAPGKGRAAAFGQFANDLLTQAQVEIENGFEEKGIQMINRAKLLLGYIIANS